MRDDGPPAVLCPGDVVVGYRVGEQLGRGGFGTVYRASCEGQPAALKLLHLPRAPGRVEREVSILLRLRHPNVVGIRAFGYWPLASPEFAVIAMEYVEGRQLDVWAREENPSARQVLLAVLGVARALAATHEAGVVHRDVKEANVMVRASDGLAVLVDYGVGDYEGAPGVTLSILPPGTPEYRPPEAWLFLEEHAGVRGARYVPGPSDDLWALGVVLYRLLTARVPFEAEDDQAFINAVISGTPVSPRTANERVPQALSEVCLRLLEKEAQARFPDARAVCAALEAVVASADAEWEVPLCDAYGPATATTEGPVDPMVRWVNDPLHRPRRGRRPEQVVEVADDAAPLDGAALAADVSPARPVEVSARTRWRKGWMALGLGLLGVATASVLLWGGGRRDEGRPVHEEVALAAKKPQAARAAAPTGPEAIPAAVARSATNSEVTATVTTTKSDTPSTWAPARKSTKGARTALATTALCGALACTGPQVRSPPEPEPCPEGSVEGMKKLGMSIGDYNDGTLLLDEPSRFLMVTEGPARITLGAQGATLTGRFIVGDRLYGRLTRARMGKGSVPVCFEVLDSSGNRGLEISGGGGDSGKVRVFSAFLVKAVSEFE
ncbi:serine/threonine protein kinase [Myxococcus stipitatus DSM 14675]|uniref:Serine/threonine protein kinase n=1 Tax=Myxococcus stipitatus (strain DSM 14675 / JCM 12634 / Mx s8) TaxID=1278073 RepID=L7U6D9_MYXSD|nr:serine/threonine-protein kinase [Myxococcus stipitatus]AGC43162.1 serine/threonine protein kinase [Myxococcus stipitatus DSM 14675]